MSPYKQALSDAMDLLAEDPLVRFVGYGLLRGRAGGTMKNVPDAQIVEMPTAENLMAGVAIGLSLKGYKPLLYFERGDFLLNAADALVNHLAAMKKLSGGEFTPTCIIRVTTGNRERPLFTGPVHTQDFSEVMWELLRGFAHERLEDPTGEAAVKHYRSALERMGDRSTIIFERKDLW